MIRAVRDCASFLHNLVAIWFIYMFSMQVLKLLYLKTISLPYVSSCSYMHSAMVVIGQSAWELVDYEHRNYYHNLMNGTIFLSLVTEKIALTLMNHSLESHMGYYSRAHTLNEKIP